MKVLGHPGNWQANLPNSSPPLIFFDFCILKWEFFLDIFLLLWSFKTNFSPLGTGTAYAVHFEREQALVLAEGDGLCDIVLGGVRLSRIVRLS